VDSGPAPPPVAPSAEPQVAARTQGEHFEVRTAQGWEPFYVKGINLGAALPGKFPSQFPADDSTYARWLELIAAANANTVRLYTILPPPFYRALRRWNAAHPDRALWLVHGVWAELPPHGNYDERRWKAAFGREMRRAAEVVHALLRDEWAVYHAQRPIAYTNWPPLDPLGHATESSRAEEQALRRRHGFPPNPRLKEYDNDVDALDAMLVRTTAADLAGY